MRHRDQPWDREFVGIFVSIAPAVAAITTVQSGWLAGLGGFGASMTFAGVWCLLRRRAWAIHTGGSDG